MSSFFLLGLSPGPFNEFYPALKRGIVGGSTTTTTGASASAGSWIENNCNWSSNKLESNFNIFQKLNKKASKSCLS